MRSKIREELSIYAKKKAVVRIDLKPGESVSGYPLALGKRFFLCRNTYDFFPDGYILLPYSRVVSLSGGPPQQFYSNILAKEGVSKNPRRIRSAEDFELVDMVTMLQKRGILVGIQGSTQPDYLFDVGLIENHTKSSLTLQGIDPQGRWDPDLTTVKYAGISEITFYSNYLSLLQKYAPSPGKN